tara:strand:- start:7 stop:345 length:339 start_codon:yes stop_codon:yes gene_type:complete
MANYYHKIRKIYEPQSVSDQDFTLRNDGSGDQIVFWNIAKLGAQPTLASLDAQVTDAEVLTYGSDTDKENKFNRDIIRATGLTMKDFMNEIMAGRTTAITNSELKTKFKSRL